MVNLCNDNAQCASETLGGQNSISNFFAVKHGQDRRELPRSRRSDRENPVALTPELRRSLDNYRGPNSSAPDDRAESSRNAKVTEEKRNGEMGAEVTIDTFVLDYESTGLDARLSKGEPEIRSWLRPTGISLRGFIKFAIDHVGLADWERRNRVMKGDRLDTIKP